MNAEQTRALSEISKKNHAKQEYVYVIGEILQHICFKKENNYIQVDKLSPLARKMLEGEGYTISIGQRANREHNLVKVSWEQ